MAETKSVLVFGATGTIGTYIFDAILAASPPFERVGIFTSAATAESKKQLVEELKAKGVHVHIGDIKNKDDISKAYSNGYDTVVSAIGRAAIADQILPLEIAEQTESVKKFFPSEYGTDIEYGPKSKDEPPHQQKLKVRKYIRENIKRLEYTFLVTGPFAEFYIGKPFGAGGYDVKAKKAILLGTGKERVSLTTMPDVGKLLVAALRHPEASKNKALIVNSFTTTPEEILAEYERQLDTKFEVQIISLEELRKMEKEAWEKVGLGATGLILKRIWTEGGTLYDHRDNEKIGFTSPDTLEVAVSRAIKAQTE
ncbi:uncharacterized protein PV09_05283 [Verruconis gallopava]|uniref:NmrA-like domain-containing protein n=1 Tax=Verruconis gallopava TaxID=253628 RepID=A0A0D2A9X9_9PEZI|nr:uncharacterized protein PV09_05283 [Verruconis gallopava]KIW03518.1 hypothetical protein PV09_05283 [Verruconis gallopava]